jgi:hypothetical protein
LIDQPERYNYTAQDVVDALMGFKRIYPNEPVYIATGEECMANACQSRCSQRLCCTDLSESELDQLEPFRKAFDAKTHFDFREFLDSLQIIDNDYLGAMEVCVICAQGLVRC